MNLVVILKRDRNIIIYERQGILFYTEVLDACFYFVILNIYEVYYAVVYIDVKQLTVVKNKKFNFDLIMQEVLPRQKILSSILDPKMAW